MLKLHRRDRNKVFQLKAVPIVKKKLIKLIKI
jgi:hypothetical protein